MPYIQSLIFLGTAVIATIFLMPMHALSNCDLENIHINLKAKNRSIADILSDIEEQSGYSIISEESDILNNKISIQFHNSDLNLALKRLLKHVDYVVLCDSAEKKLSLLLLDKTGSVASKQQQNYNSNSGDAGMDEISAMLNEYPNADKNAQYSQDNQDAPEMDGIETAMQDFQSNIYDLSESADTQDSREMDEISTAMEDYNSNISNGVNQEMQNGQETSMDEVSRSFSSLQANASPEYISNAQNQLEDSPSPEDQNHPMDDVDHALEEYMKQNR
jgi:hypothetical protein